MTGLSTLITAANVALSISIFALTVSSLRNRRGPAHGRSWLFFAAASLTLLAHAIVEALEPTSPEVAGVFEIATVSLLGGGLVLLYGADRDELRRLQGAAERDPMTQLYNLQVFRTLADARLSTTAATALAVAVLDLDSFKDVNDTFGHPAGDRTLRLVATAIRASLRASDIAARYGGDEFVLLLDGCDGASAERILHRIRSTVAALSTAAGEPVSLSAGIASSPECGRAIDELIQRADAALLLAKRGGKNDVRHAPTPEHA
jgi:diguanylate cyclase (GGDEF)-like protein